MNKKRKKYTPEFKTNAINYVIKDGMTLSSASKLAGITSGMLSKWIKSFEKEKMKDLPTIDEVKKLKKRIDRIETQYQTLANLVTKTIKYKVLTDFDKE